MLDTTGNIARLRVYDTSGNQIGLEASVNASGATAAQHMFYGNGNPALYSPGFHIQYMNITNNYLSATAAQFPLLLSNAPPAFLSAGILDPARSMDYKQAGIAGGIPSVLWPACVTAACNTALAAGTSATTAQINAALSSAAGSNVHVDIASGTYNFASGGILFPPTGHVALRALGIGADFIFNGSPISCGHVTCFVGALDAANANITNPPGSTTPWTAGYAQGTTLTTLTSVAGINTTSSALPTLLVYSQCDTGLTTGVGCTTGTNADNGNLFASDQLYNSGAHTGCCGNGPGNIISNRGSMEIHVASSVVGNQPNLTIPISMPNITAGQIPMEFNVQSIATFGLENIRVKDPTVAAAVGIAFQNAYNWWVQGGAVTDSNSKITWGFNCLGCANGEFQSSYIYKISGNPNPYGIRCMMCSYNLFDNNTIQQTGTPMSFDGSSSGNVIAFNYCMNATFFPSSNILQPCFNSHATSNKDFYEGNIATEQYNDGIHGNSNMVNNYRNRYTGWWSQPSNPINGFTNARGDASFSRYESDVFGVYGSAIYHTVRQLSASCTGTAAPVWIMGSNCPYAGSPGVPTDTLSLSTLMRWGMYDTVSNTVSFAAGEVPTGAPVYPNPPPTVGNTGIGQAAAPPSFYLTARPSWYPASKPFPAIGPDVTGGNLGRCGGVINTPGQFAGMLATNPSQCAGQGLIADAGGHANSIPAMDCALALGMPVDGSGPVLPFNSGTCPYNSSGGGGPIVSFTPTPQLDFGNQPPNTTSNAQTITVTNTGTTNLVLAASNAVTLTGTNAPDFAVTVQNCTNNLVIVPTGTCTMQLTFTPSVVGARSAQINVNGNASGVEPLVGNGTVAAPTAAMQAGNLVATGNFRGAN